MSSDDTLYGLVAKTRAGRERFQAELASVLPGTFPALETGKWWTDADAGIALCSARLVVSKSAGRPSAVALTGDFYPAPVSENTNACEDLLEQLRRHGAGMLRERAGDFAIAFWDSERSSLHLVRDHFGQRTIFLRDDGDFVAICSELEPLLSDAAFECQLDFESAHNFLSFGLPLPGRTLARGVTCVPASHELRWESGMPFLARRYYTPLAFDHPVTVDATHRSEIVRTLDDAILARDGRGRGAILLSGGVDSSYIAVTCAMRNGGSGYDAYTIDFMGVGVASEAEFAAIVANKAGIRHHVVPMTVADAIHSFNHVLGQAQPCSAWAALTHHHMLTKIRADGHSQVLSGLGADEVFGGYSKYLRSYRRLRGHEAQWKGAGKVAAFDGLLWSPASSRSTLFHGVPRFFDDRALHQGLHPPFDSWNFSATLVEFYRECRRFKPDSHLFELMVAHECQNRIPDLLMAGFEPMAREVGIRTSYPFLDPSVASVACALGASERFWLSDGRWKNKKALRRIALDRLPTEIVTRKPMSYTTPILSWLADPGFGDAAIARLRSSRFWSLGLVRIEWLERIMSEINARLHSKPGSIGIQIEQLWILIVLSAWCDKWVFNETNNRWTANA